MQKIPKIPTSTSSGKITRGRVLSSVLQCMSEVATGMTDVFAVFVSARYGASYSKLDGELRKRQRASADEEERERARRQYAVLICRLQRDGIIEKQRRREGWFLSLTKKGARKLAVLRAQKSIALPDPSYGREEGGDLVVVAFDIPERERTKRNWIRAVLKNLGLRMVQQSVWMGTAKIPERFLADLHKLHLIDSVEIFIVNKQGTLRHIA